MLASSYSPEIATKINKVLETNPPKLRSSQQTPIEDVASRVEDVDAVTELCGVGHCLLNATVSSHHQCRIILIEQNMLMRVVARAR